MKYLLLLLSLLLLCSCGAHDDSSYNSFGWKLQGVWEKANTESWEYPAAIEIGYNSIVITGTVNHFQGLPREVELEAYADSSFIHINASGEWQTPVSYVYWETGSSYPKTRMLTLKGHSYHEQEIFKFVEEPCDNCF